ncbi:hypothetical protein L9F63_023610, partial [Diploptera punctata]
AGADRYDAARRKRVLEEGDRATPAELKVKKGNHSRTSEGASCSFTETPELERPRTCRPPAGARKNVAPLPIKKRKFMHAPAGETEPEHHVVEQEVTVPPPPQQVPVQPQVSPGPSGTQLPHSLIEDRVSTSEPSSDSDETEQSQPRDPVTVVDLTQESDNEILDSVQCPAVPTAPPVFPTASRLIPYNPLPQVVPPLVSPSRQNQCSSSEPAQVPSAPQPISDHVRRERMLSFRQLMKAAERRRIDTPAMDRRVHYSQQSPVAPPLRHQYGMHHHHQPPVPTRQQPTVYSHPEGRSAMIPPPMLAPPLQTPGVNLLHALSLHENPGYEVVYTRHPPSSIHIVLNVARPQGLVIPPTSPSRMTAIREEVMRNFHILLGGVSQDTIEQVTFPYKYKQ